MMRILVPTGATLAGGLLLACLSGDGSAAAAAEPPATAMVADVQVTLPEHVVTSGHRSLDQQQPWGAKRVLPYELAEDRAAARARSLARRAELRAFEGAPPVMPHSATFGEGSKACVDCHTVGMTLGERVAHPMSHPPLASCTQCHIESTNRDLSSAPRVATEFEGARPPAASTPAAGPGMPRVIPHTLHMRTRCLSCHGELGYPGLRTSHPERAACVQCHIPKEPER